MNAVSSDETVGEKTNGVDDGSKHFKGERTACLDFKMRVNDILRCRSPPMMLFQVAMHNSIPLHVIIWLNGKIFQFVLSKPFYLEMIILCCCPSRRRNDLDNGFNNKLSLILSRLY